MSVPETDFPVPITHKSLILLTEKTITITDEQVSQIFYFPVIFSVHKDIKSVRVIGSPNKICLTSDDQDILQRVFDNLSNVVRKQGIATGTPV